ncbi:MAG TPA: sugar phosphate isomerase/epimerase family protein [Bryobacteraceae bacterium]|jgi:sugar phosphate isomerase/epimerase
MQLGCVTYNILKDLDVEGIIALLEKTGFAAVELRTGHKHGVEPSLDHDARERIRQRFERSKVRLLSLGTECEFESPDPAVRRKNIELAQTFIQLAHDVGARGIKVRPNGVPKDKSIPLETTIRNIGTSLHEVGEIGTRFGVQIWMEVHANVTSNPPVAAQILKTADHKNVGACWNSNPVDIVDGSVKPSFELLRPYIRNCHIHDLYENYPYRELFALLNRSGYQGYTLCESPESPEPERYLRYYKALWTELNRA